MKKTIYFLLFILCLGAFGCKHTETTYNRQDRSTYEEFLSRHVFAACSKPGSFLATYSLAKIKQTPANNDPRYKVQFVQGPCKGNTVMTTDIIFKTEPVENVQLRRGMVVLHNAENPKEEYNREANGRWNKAILSDTSRYDRGILDLGFPRDRNDFNPARESVYSFNVRVITKPENVKDIRTFL